MYVNNIHHPFFIPIEIFSVLSFIIFLMQLRSDTSRDIKENFGSNPDVVRVTAAMYGGKKVIHRFRTL
jgi:hypothetical protein